MNRYQRTTFIVLLRGINVSGHHKIPMPELRALCAENGWNDVQTYIQSGNLVFSAPAAPAVLEADLKRSIEAHFGFAVPVIVRTAADWRTYVESNPFSAESETEPHLVMLALSKAPPHSEAVHGLRERAAAGERIDRIGDALWICFKDGVARSKLTPALFDWLVGSPVTARNWCTVLKIAELAERYAVPAGDF